MTATNHGYPLIKPPVKSLAEVLMCLTNRILDVARVVFVGFPLNQPETDKGTYGTTLKKHTLPYLTLACWQSLSLTVREHARDVHAFFIGSNLPTPR